MIDIEEIRQNQPTINVGMIGSVSNGKSSLTRNLTGIKTQKHSAEHERNITIKLGYANTKIYKCPSCTKPECYKNYPSNIYNANCTICNADMVLEKHISFIDCPGHNLLMATMLNGACVMDSSIIVESVANIEMPSPQTIEHLLATDMLNLRSAFVCMNKVDITSRNNTIKNIQKFNNFMETKRGVLPIVPISANLGLNTDVVCEYICDMIKEPKRDLESGAKMIIIRSFNINKQNTKIEKLQGGVAGGTLVKGILKIGDTVKILPGFLTKNQNNEKKKENREWTYQPIITTVESINSEKNNLDMAIPGGLIGVKLSIDPSISANDGLVGSTLVKNDNTDQYKIFERIFVHLEKVFEKSERELKKDDIIVINYNAYNVKGKIIKMVKNKMEIKLIDKPLCVELNDYITISKPVNHDMQNTIIIGRAKIITGVESIM